MTVMLAGGACFYFAPRAPLVSSPTMRRESARTIEFQERLMNHPNHWRQVIPAANLIPPAVVRRAPSEAWSAPSSSVAGTRQSLFIELPDPVESAMAGQPSYSSSGLLGDDRFELVAFATWIPAADDPLDAGPELVQQLLWRDPTSLLRLEPEDIDQLDVPFQFRSIQPGRASYPILRLLFRASNMPHTRIFDPEAADARTDWVVSEWESVQAWGAWSCVDLPLRIWHNTPLVVALEVLTGDPIYEELQEVTNAQALFGSQLRLQWLGTLGGHGQIHSATSHPLMTSAKHKSRTLRSEWDLAPSAALPGGSVEIYTGLTEPESVTMMRISSADYAEQCGAVAADGSLNWLIPFNRWSQGAILASMVAPSPVDQPLCLALIPNRTTLEFHVAGLPDMPNPSDVENLYDVRIPRFTISTVEELPFVGGSSVECVFLYGVTNPTELYLRNALQLGFEADLPGLPEDRTFRDTTPQQLLDWYLAQFPATIVEYDREGHTFYVNEHAPSKAGRLRDWWYFNKPDWLRRSPP